VSWRKASTAALTAPPILLCYVIIQSRESDEKTFLSLVPFSEEALDSRTVLLSKGIYQRWQIVSPQLGGLMLNPLHIVKKLFTAINKIDQRNFLAKNAVDCIRQPFKIRKTPS
jgi:hypothetical protein